MSLKEAKILLYSLFLKIPVDKMTDNEIDIAHTLSKDEDIQEIFNK